MRFTIAKKIIISVVTMIIVSAFMGGYSYYAVNKASGTSTLIAQGLAPMNAYNTDLVGYSFLMDNYVQMYYLVGNESDLNNANIRMKQAKDTLAKMKTLIESPLGVSGMPATGVIFPDIEKSVTNYVALAERGLDIMKKSKPQEMEAFKVSDDFSALLMQFYEFMHKSVKMEIAQNNNELAQRAEEVMNTTVKMSFIQMRAATLFRTGVAANNYDTINQSIKMYGEITTMLTELSKTVKMPETVAYINKCNEVLAKLQKQMNEIQETYTNISKINSEQEKASDTLNEYMMQLASTLSGGTVRISQKAADDMGQLSIAILVLLVITVIVGVGATLILRVSVTLKINAFINIVKDLTSGDGDLTKRIPTMGTDELAELAGHFNRFIINVQEIVSEVKQAADNLASGNNQLAATMEELSTTFNSQTEEVSGIVNEMGGIQDAASQSEEALNKCMDIMDSTVKETEKGSRELGEVESSIVEIRHQTESLSETIKRLSGSSAQIGEILTVINDIADQTNLLALNAAIEAARAGDAGRGFAVVADEVRKLAERTQKATSEIETIITSLQHESEMASKEMTSASKSVETGVEVIGKTAQSFDNIVNSVTSVTNTTRGVVATVAGQNAAVQNVGDKTQVIASGVEESNAAVSEITITVAHLQESAAKMKSLVGQFKS